MYILKGGGTIKERSIVVVGCSTVVSREMESYHPVYHTAPPFEPRAARHAAACDVRGAP